MRPMSRSELKSSSSATARGDQGVDCAEIEYVCDDYCRSLMLYDEEHEECVEECIEEESRGACT